MIAWRQARRSHVATLGYGGMLLGPPLVGLIVELVGLRLAFATLGVLALVSASLAPALAVPGAPR